MRKVFIIFALFCAMFLFAACGSDSKESVYGDTDTSDSTSDKPDSDTTDTNSDDGDSQSDSTADTTPDNGDSADDPDSDKPDSDNPDTTPDNGDTAPDNGDSADDTDSSDSGNDSGDSQSDDDADTSHGNEPEVGDTREAGCTGLPVNASWNTVSTITQTWNGNEWTPSTEATFGTNPSNTKCRFVCNQNYEWNDSECVAGTRTANCDGLPNNAVWNTASSITQTWDGDEWIPSSTGTYNTYSSQSECRFKCAENYNWTGSQCAAAIQPANCTDLPENALWNTVSSITQTWNGTEWIPATNGTYNEATSYSECRFVCKTNYSWNGILCAPDEKDAVACTGKPTNSVWNSVSTITQTWNGTEWIPSTSAIFSETPSTTECRFKCADNFDWNGLQCAFGTRNMSCTGLPTNAQWNNASEITQTWDGNEWIPTNIGSFNTSASQSECYFKCNEHYTWNNTVCQADTQPATCTGLPEHAIWNSVSDITQTWNGNDWTPSNIGSFNASASTTECRFRCDTNYSWNSSTSACEADSHVSKCNGLPEHASWNSASSITQTWNGTEWIPSNVGSFNTEASSTECHFKCNEHYNWESATSTCKAETKTSTCTGLPTNAQWNNVSEITQTWNGSAFMPTTVGTYNTEPSSTECRYKCADTYHWENSACVLNTKTSDCTGLPANAQWNTASSITQTWNGTEWTPATAGTYNETASSSECHFKCNEHYTWNPSTLECEADTQSANCEGLPANAVWNTATSITQTWNGYAWSPSIVGTYNETATSSECHYKCAAAYHMENNNCISNTRTNVACSELPENAAWNIVSKITQTWNDNEWIPSAESEYNEQESYSECRFICNDGYTYEDGECINQRTVNCTGLPANAEWNTVSSITQNWSSVLGMRMWLPSSTGTYNETPSTTACRYKCNSTSHYENSKCEPNTRTANCTDLPTGAVWNTATSITQTWDGSQWTPSTTGVYSSTASTTQCKYKCATNYTWDKTTLTCKADSRLSNCTNLPVNADWNTVSTITQTWNGSSWQPPTSASYSATSSTTECKFKCEKFLEWNDSKCVINTDYTNVNLARICTGQTSCYNASSSITCPTSGDFYGQDAQYAKLGYCVQKSFSLEGSNADQMIVVDNNTGLRWQQTIKNASLSFNSAQTYCSSLTYGGETGWRLPTIIELFTIADTDSSIFPTSSYPFWSSSSSKNRAYYMLKNNLPLVRFDISSNDTTTYSSVRCVK